MNLRVHVEDLDDDRRQEIVAYVSRDGGERPEIQSVVQQADPAKARQAAAALIASGLHAAEHVGDEEVRALLDEYDGLRAAA